MSKAQPGWELYAPFACLGVASSAWDIWFVGAGGREAIRLRTARRFEELVQFARTQSPYYARLLRDLPRAGLQAQHIPPVKRQSLMAHFDEWVTDSNVTLDAVRAFAADPGRVGQPYLGRYAVWSSSGTTGEPGLFVHDLLALAVYDALDAVRLGGGGPGTALAASSILTGSRYAMVGATGGHFAGLASVERMRQLAPLLADRLRIFSILEPLPRLVESLNLYRPTFVATYPTAASLLAREHHRGRLDIGPAAFWLGGETLTSSVRTRVNAEFQCETLESYGASECLSIACSCRLGRLHLNADWVMLEPVDRNYRPVPPGATSHTVLITNLANRVQPIIRYDLGDSVWIAPGPCECGSLFPALRVDGRSDEVLRLRDKKGNRVDLLPLAVTTVVEETAAAHQFQIVQTAPDALGVRVEGHNGVDESSLWRGIAAALRAYLDSQGLSSVAIHRDLTPLQRSPRSGKLRRVIAARHA